MNQSGNSGIFVMSVYTENRIGILNRISGVLARRRLNIESLAVNESREKGIHHCQFRIRMKEDQALRVSEQVNKLVDVLAVSVLPEKSVAGRHLGIFRLRYLPESRHRLLAFLQKANARILEQENDQLEAEKTGGHEEVYLFREQLKEFGDLLGSGTAFVWSPKEEDTFLKSHAVLNEE